MVIEWGMTETDIAKRERYDGWVCLKFRFGFDDCNDSSCGWMGLLWIVTQIGYFMIGQRNLAKSTF